MSGFAGDLFIRIRPDFSGFESELQAGGGKATASSGAAAAGLAATTTETKALAGATATLSTEARAAELGFADLLATNRALQASAGQTAAAEGAVAAATEASAIAARQAAVSETNLEGVRVRARRSSSVGPLRFAGIGLAAGAGLFVATQAIGALGNALAVTGNEAGTTQGRLRNLGAELLHGNIVGAFSQLGKFTHEFSVAEIEAVNASPKLTAQLKAIGGEAALAAGNLAALKAQTQIPTSLQLGVARSQAQGTPANQLDALRREDQQIGRQIAEAKTLHVSQAELDAALTDLFNQRIANHSAQRALIGKDAQILAQANKDLLAVGQQVDSVIATLQADAAQKQADIIGGIIGGGQEGVLDAQIAGSATGQIAADQRMVATLQNLLRNKKLSAEERQQIKSQIVSANSDIESINNQIAQDEQQRLQSDIDLLKSQITSPLDAEITRLENQLNAIRSREQAQSIKDRLAKAKQDLADARQSVQIIGAVTPGQRKDIDAFLQPFRSEVSAAQGAQKEAGIQSRIDALKTREQNLLAPLDRTARAGETQVQLLREIKAALLANQRGAGKTPPKTSRDTPGAAAGATARDLAGLAT